MWSSVYQFIVGFVVIGGGLFSLIGAIWASSLTDPESVQSKEIKESKDQESVYRAEGDKYQAERYRDGSRAEVEIGKLKDATRMADAVSQYTIAKKRMEDIAAGRVPATPAPQAGAKVIQEKVFELGFLFDKWQSTQTVEAREDFYDSMNRMRDDLGPLDYQDVMERLKQAYPATAQV